MKEKIITQIVGDACPECRNGLLNPVSDLKFGDVRNVTGVRCRSCGYEWVDPTGFQRLVDAEKRGFNTK